MLSTLSNRERFIDSVISLLRKHKFDGLDLFFLYPGLRGSPKSDQWTFLLLIEVRPSLAAPGSGNDSVFILAGLVAQEGQKARDRGRRVVEECSLTTIILEVPGVSRSWSSPAAQVMTILCNCLASLGQAVCSLCS